MQVRPGFPLDSQDCELLLALEQAGSLAGVAAALGRDVSVVSRRLVALARRAPVLEKRERRWEVTALGRRLNRWTTDVVSAQRGVLREQQSLRVGTTREFAARVLMPALRELFPASENLVITVRTYEQGIEQALLAGELDFGFDCGRPQDPAIRYSIGAREPFVVCAAPRFLRAHRVRVLDDLLALPHVLYTRVQHDVSKVALVSNDIACAREAVVRGLGWATLPLYCVRDELDRRALQRVPGPVPDDEHFGVWALRENTAAAPWVARALAWLKARRLD